MPASPAEPSEMIRVLMERWIDDPDSPVVYTEQVGGRRAVRMRQQIRDFTTVWFDVGERSVRIEAYVVPAGDQPVELLRQCLVRNRNTWRTRYCIDEQNGIVLRARVALENLDEAEMSFVMAEIYEQIEVGFRPLLRALGG